MVRKNGVREPSTARLSDEEKEQEVHSRWFAVFAVRDAPPLGSHPSQANRDRTRLLRAHSENVDQFGRTILQFPVGVRYPQPSNDTRHSHPTGPVRARRVASGVSPHRASLAAIHRPAPIDTQRPQRPIPASLALSGHAAGRPDGTHRRVRA